MSCLISFACKPKGQPEVTPGSAADALPFNPVGWQAAGPHRWTKSNGAQLELSTAMPPAPIDVQNVDRFRDVMRQEILQRSGGLVSADLAGAGVGRVIAKFPQKPSGMTYEGWLVYEHEGAAQRLIVRVPETGVTGVRDTVIFDAWMNDHPDAGDEMTGWMQDPYDKSRKDPLMKNGAEDATYDAKFPDHPLSLVRVELAAIEASLHP